MPEFTKLTNVELQRYIDYHQSKDGFGSPELLAAVKERDSRHHVGLSLEKTLELIKRAASEGRYLSYGEVAEFSGVDWKAARRPMAKYLGEVCKFAHGKGWPLLSSIVVNKDHLNTGELELESLTGFIKVAKELGYRVGNERRFLDEHQRQVFDWGKRRGWQLP